MIVRRREGTVLHQLRTLYNVGTIGDLSDRQLLERFATDSDDLAELAFAALVERHEAMVWRVCLAIVRNEHQAEDAFQATFFVLVRKARSLWVRDSLGPWLHQVACRTASCLRKNVIRRRTHERRCAEKNAGRSVEVGTSRDFDVHAAVHEEVDRLPEKYRAPLVLCDLEGRTHQEAARFLGWPIGTVKSRQSKGRGLIRDRLVGRGLGLAVVGAGAESLTQTAVGAARKEVLRSTVLAGMQQSAGRFAGFEVSGNALSLTQEVLTAMMWTRLRFLTVALIVGAIASGAAVSYVRGSQEPAPKDEQAVSRPPTTKPAATAQPEETKTATRKPAPSISQVTLRAQQLATRRAQTLYEIAKLTRELAEIAVEEYEEVDYPGELATAESELKLAESELPRAEDRFAEAKKRVKNKILPPSQTEELSLQKARFALEQAQFKRKILVDFTKDKNLKELKSKVEKAKSDALAKRATWLLEKAKETKLERELHSKTN